MEISCHIFKLGIFSKFFGDLMSYIIREYADEEIEYFLYIWPLKIMGMLLSVFLVSSLSIKLFIEIKLLGLGPGLGKTYIFGILTWKHH